MGKPCPVQSQANGNDLPAQQRRWPNHFRQCQNSGLSMAAYARPQGIREKTFCYWRNRLLGQPAEQTTVKEPEFHPARITPPDAPGRPERVPILLRLPNGVECELQHIEVCTGLEVLDKLARMRAWRGRQVRSLPCMRVQGR
jgi:hypothetical protein